MSNASNLSTLANVLDDGSSGQFLKSTGSGGVAFDTVAAGAVVYATADLLPLSGFAAGDMAYVTATNRFYINNGSGWYSVSLVNTNPNITSVQDAGSNTTPFTLATDGSTATVVTITAADPEGVPLTYSYGITNGSLNGCTVTGADGTSARVAGTAYTDNVFTVTPHASQDATFTLTFTASDGINQATSANAFSLSFVTTVTDSNHTTLLATATSIGDNSTIEDSSSNNHSITVYGDATAGTFSPYRSGGYSLSLNGTDESFEPNHSSASGLGTTWSVSCWAYIPSSGATNLYPYIFDFDRQNSSGNGFALQANLSFKNFSLTTVNLGAIINTATSLTCFDKWSYYVITHSSGTTTFYIDGSSVGSTTSSGMANVAAVPVQQLVIGGNRYDESSKYTKMDVRDFHVRSAAHNGAVNNEAAVADSNTVILAAHKPYLASQTGASTALTPVINNDVSTKPFSPYDYNEYDAADHGGSIYFDGSGDYLKHQVPALGTGDFEISCWIYASTLDFKFIFDYRFGATNNPFAATLANGKIRVYTEADILIDSAAGVISAGQWYYIAYKRVSGTSNLYVNGNSVGSATDTTSFASVTNGYVGRRYDVSSYMWDGYISDFRIITSPTSSGYAIPTAPLSSSGTSLHIKGTDASIIDKSQGFNLNLVGNTTGSTTQTKFSNTKSMYFDASGDYISISDNEAYGFGTDDWTIETWLYCTKTGGFNAIFDTRVGTGTEAGSFGLGMHTTGRVQMYSNATSPAQFLYPSSTLSFNTWQHLAIVKNSGTTTMYFNGTAASTTYSDSRNYGSSQPVQIGKDDTTSNYFGGYMQDFRITKGLARYTGNFTPPSAPLEG